MRVLVANDPFDRVRRLFHRTGRRTKWESAKRGAVSPGPVSRDVHKTDFGPYGLIHKIDWILKLLIIRVVPADELSWQDPRSLSQSRADSICRFSLAR